MEKDKASLMHEVEDLQAAVDQETKGKSHMEKMAKQLEVQVPCNCSFCHIRGFAMLEIQWLCTQYAANFGHLQFWYLSGFPVASSYSSKLSKSPVHR